MLGTEMLQGCHDWVATERILLWPSNETGGDKAITINFVESVEGHVSANDQVLEYQHHRRAGSVKRQFVVSTKPKAVF